MTYLFCSKFFPITNDFKYRVSDFLIFSLIGFHFGKKLGQNLSLGHIVGSELVRVVSPTTLLSLFTLAFSFTFLGGHFQIKVSVFLLVEEALADFQIF